MGKWKERAKEVEQRLTAVCSDLEWSIKERQRLVEDLREEEEFTRSQEEHIGKAEAEIERLREVETKLEARIRDLSDFASDVSRAQDSAAFLALADRARRLLGTSASQFGAVVLPACGSGEHLQPGDNGQ